MPRKYIRKSTQGNYSSETLCKALREVASGVPIRAASRQYGISAKTLRCHHDSKVRSPGKVRLGRLVLEFTAEQEQALVVYIIMMEKALFDLTTLDVRRLAYDYAEKLNIRYRFNKESILAGLEWLRAFLKLHPPIVNSKA